MLFSWIVDARDRPDGGKRPLNRCLGYTVLAACHPARSAFRQDFEGRKGKKDSGNMYVRGCVFYKGHYRALCCPPKKKCSLGVCLTATPLAPKRTKKKEKKKWRKIISTNQENPGSGEGSKLWTGQCCVQYEINTCGRWFKICRGIAFRLFQKTLRGIAEIRCQQTHPGVSWRFLAQLRMSAVFRELGTRTSILHFF
jgi:hypothetical protein